MGTNGNPFFLVRNKRATASVIKPSYNNNLFESMRWMRGEKSSRSPRPLNILEIYYSWPIKMIAGSNGRFIHHVAAIVCHHLIVSAGATDTDWWCGLTDAISPFLPLSSLEGSASKLCSFRDKEKRDLLSICGWLLVFWIVSYIQPW